MTVRGDAVVTTVDVGVAVRALPVRDVSPMSGFAARTLPSKGFHDALSVRALDLGAAVIISVDVCGIEESTCTAIAQRVRPHAPGSVLVCATHTHAGPCSMPTRLGGCDPETEQLIIDTAVATAVEAATHPVPCQVGYSEQDGVGVAQNRRHPGHKIDPPVQALRFTGIDGAEVAVLLTYPCHPVVLDASNRLLSGDYVHYARATVESDLPGTTAVFLTGCAGDVNTGHSAESSYSVAGASNRTFAEAERIGTLVGRAATRAEPAPITTTANFPAVAYLTAEVELLLEPLAPSVLSGQVKDWRAERLTADAGKAALLDIWLDWADHRTDATSWTSSVSVVRIGEVRIVALPGEPFLDCVAQLRHGLGQGAGAAQAPTSLVVGYTNGCPGYFPTAEEYPHGGYEVCDAHRYYAMPAPFAQGSAETLVAKAVQLCRQVG